jgi:effector-binding domain-containing protein
MEIEIADVPPQRVYAISSGPAPIPREQLPALIWRLFDQLDARLDQVGIVPPPIHLVWYERVTGYLGDLSIRVWVGYAAPSPGEAGEIGPTVLDGAHVAVTRVEGDPEKIRSAWNEMIDWVQAHGGRTSGWAREVHEKAWPLPQEQWVTELQLPFSGELTP